MTTRNNANLLAAVDRFMEVDKRIRHGELRVDGRAYRQAIKALREAYYAIHGEDA